MKNYLKKLYDLLFQAVYLSLYHIGSILPLKLYQPIYGQTGNTNITRGCEDRWKVMVPHLDEAGSFLDIGSNIGFFTFKAAEKGNLACGVEVNRHCVTFSNAIKAAQKSDNAFFLNGMITPEFIKVMPSYNTVNNLSVFHHWVKAYGAIEAQNMMRLLATKCETLFFETGQPDEAGTKWAHKMDFMGDDPAGWIKSFLHDIGFSQVNVIGTFPTGLTQTDRYLFVGRK